MMPDSIRATLLAALADYQGSGKRAAILWVDLEPLERLSERETEVVRLVAQGMGNKAVARELDLAEPSVRSHLNNIYGKLGVENRTQAARWFWQHSILVTSARDEVETEPVEGGDA